MAVWADSIAQRFHERKISILSDVLGVKKVSSAVDHLKKLLFLKHLTFIPLSQCHCKFWSMKYAHRFLPFEFGNLLILHLMVPITFLMCTQQNYYLLVLFPSNNARFVDLWLVRLNILIVNGKFFSTQIYTTPLFGDLLQSQVQNTYEDC